MSATSHLRRALPVGLMAAFLKVRATCFVGVVDLVLGGGWWEIRVLKLGLPSTPSPVSRGCFFVLFCFVF